jgi:FixJ family two-component response regulator
MTPAAANKPTVFVVDDDRQMRQSLTVLLETLRYCVRAFSSAGAFHRVYRAHMPGCLLLDVRMPAQDGLALFEQLQQEGKLLPVIFITAHADVTTAVAAMKTGAIEYLEKPFDRHTLVDRIQKALALDAKWRQRDADFTALQQRIGRLTDRDRETLELLSAGESNKMIAAKLLLTERAVEMRRASLMRRLQVNSLAELIDLTVTHRIHSELRFAAKQRQIS